MIVKVFCQICKEHIGNADTDTLSVPLKGSMFTSKDPAHGFPPPFVPEVEWEDMECPWGPHRPFLEPNMVLTDIGVIIVPRGGALEVSVPSLPAPVPQTSAPPPPDESEEKTKPDEPPQDDDTTSPPLAEGVDMNARIYPCQCLKCGNEFMSDNERDEECPRCRAGLPPIKDPEMPSIHELERQHKMEEDGDGYVDAEETNTEPPAEDTQEKAPTEDKGQGSFICDHPGCGKSFKSQAALYAHSRVHKAKKG